MSEMMVYRVERMIVRRVVLDAIKAGYLLSVNNGDDEDEIGPCKNVKAIMEALFATGDELLIFHRQIEYASPSRAGWVRFVHGNGACVISDYTTNLESVLTEANKLADKYDD